MPGSPSLYPQHKCPPPGSHCCSSVSTAVPAALSISQPCRWSLICLLPPTSKSNHSEIWSEPFLCLSPFSESHNICAPVMCGVLSPLTKPTSSPPPYLWSHTSELCAVCQEPHSLSFSPSLERLLWWLHHWGVCAYYQDSLPFSRDGSLLHLSAMYWTDIQPVQ